MMHFKGLAKAPMFNKGKYLPPDGDFRLKIANSFTKKTQQIGFVFILEYEVLESSLDSVKVGSRYSWMQKLNDENIAFPAIKEMLVALFRIDKSDDEQMAEFEEQIEEIMEEAGDSKWENMSAERLRDEEAGAHPLVDMTVCVTTFNKKTKEKGNDFTVHQWSEDDEED